MRSSHTGVLSFRFRNFIRVSIAVSSKKLVLPLFVSCMSRVTKSRPVFVCNFPFICVTLYSRAGPNDFFLGVSSLSFSSLLLDEESEFLFRSSFFFSRVQ